MSHIKKKTQRTMKFDEREPYKYNKLKIKLQEELEKAKKTTIEYKKQRKEVLDPFKNVSIVDNFKKINKITKSDLTSKRIYRIKQQIWQKVYELNELGNPCIFISSNNNKPPTITGSSMLTNTKECRAISDAFMDSWKQKTKNHCTNCTKTQCENCKKLLESDNI